MEDLDLNREKKMMILSTKVTKREIYSMILIETLPQLKENLLILQRRSIKKVTKQITVASNSKI